MDEVRSIIERSVAALAAVPGVRAVVLGGSRARGTHTPKSDIDIGVYYDAATLGLAALDAAARDMDDGHGEHLIAPPGGWGKWVNGGGWLTVDGISVDFILRDVERVENAIAECRAGVVSAHYQPGHPHAYLNAMYMGELAVSRLLWDGTGEVSRLKAVAEVYPAELRAAIARYFGFEAEFSCQLAERYAPTDDAYYVAAHIVRAVSALNQALFARNEQYLLNEKRAVKMIGTFAVKPEGYKEKVDEILAEAGKNPPAACEKLGRLVEEVKRL